MKKNVMMRIASVLLIAVLISTCGISGTYAKYVTSVKSSDTARVAKWAFELNSTDLANNFTFNLFDTVNEADTTTSEKDVTTGTNETIIAPGTGGSFALKLTNKSEVNATYAIAWEVTNTSNIPLEYSLNGTDWNSTLDNVTATAINMNADATVTVYWRWAFETTNGDAADTELGTAGTATVTVKATVTVTQVD